MVVKYLYTHDRIVLLDGEVKLPIVRKYHSKARGYRHSDSIGSTVNWQTVFFTQPPERTRNFETGADTFPSYQ